MREEERTYGGKTEEELQALHEAASAHPWTWVKAYELRGVHWCLENEQSAKVGSTLNYHLVTISTEEYEYNDDGDATRLDQTPDFQIVVAARNALPDLLADVGRLRATQKTKEEQAVIDAAIMFVRMLVERPSFAQERIELPIMDAMRFALLRSAVAALVKGGEPK